ncbi:MAG: hypothetical protein HYY20_12890, partial [Candidatus Tectomicrobia bacterium]|nr:hypothetical protein [Candidatus Tectomicrobia bacterium]
MESILENFVQEVKPLKHYRPLSLDEVHQRGRTFMEAFLKSVQENDLCHFISFIRKVVGERAAQGYGLEEILKVFEVLEGDIWSSVIQDSPPSEAPKLLKIVNTIFSKSKDEIAKVYLGLRVRAESKLQAAYKKLKNTQAQLIHSEKMASLGQLVAGVAHELNNPINFIYSNMDHLREYITKIKHVLAAYAQVPSPNGSYSSTLQQLEAAQAIEREVELDFILEDLDKLIKAFYDGAERTKRIVLNLRSFSRVDHEEFGEVDIHECIESTLNLLTHLYRHRIELHKSYGTLPRIHGYAGHLNQVFMNLLTNAGQAIDGQGDVWITTTRQGEKVIISLRDNGRGIPSKHLSQIFDPFFTTKGVREGTGLGLSIT